MKLKDRIAVISGGAAGIGYAAAQLFLEEGAVVNICDVNEQRITEAVEKLSSLGTVRGYVCDISKKDMVLDMMGKIHAEFGHIDILINNAGITKDAQFYKMTDEQFDAVINVNLRGNYNMTKAVVPYMMEQKYGKIVHCASVSAFNGNFGQSNYAASKAGMIGLTKSIAKEYGAKGICVNAVAPGFIMTKMTEDLPDAVKEEYLKKISLKRFGTCEEVANTVEFLAGHGSDYITGQVIEVTGGMQ